ncbi:MAG: hypothetical protein HQM10_21795 [Candidatus Riflebacteria bacterium]|nr:hypothetical protein [Candidatus Riflebacteria bacterium]
MNRSRSGIVLGVVVFSSLILGIFLFAYNSFVRQQNRRAHHEQISEVASTLALSGVNMLAEQMTSSLDTIINNAAPNMKTLIQCDEDNPANWVADSSEVSGSTMQQVKKDYQSFLNQLTNLSEIPICEKMELSFDNIQQLTPSTTPEQYQAGRDPVEKMGEVVLSCTISYKGAKRKAQIERQFRVVSMVPGIFARFTLFTAKTPHYNSFNALGTVYNGIVDNQYTHFPGMAMRAPLKLINGTDTSFANPQDPIDLKTRGWVFLGPSEAPNPNGGVLLKIPGGFENAAGGSFMFCRSIPGDNGVIVRPEIIPDDTNFNSSALNTIIGGVYQGFYTNQMDTKGTLDPSDDVPLSPTKGADTSGMWPLTTGYQCASTWLFPYGDNDNPSRTLIVGPVLAGFLKFYFLKEKSNAWPGTIIPNVASSAYNPSDRINPAVAATPKFSELCNPSSSDPVPPPDKTGLSNYYLIRAFNFVANFDDTPSVGVAFNVLFDFMAYEPPGTEYPKVFDGSARLAAQDNFCVPNASTINEERYGHIKGVHPHEDFQIKFMQNPPGGYLPEDNLYYRGNLAEFEVSDKNLIRRSTHVIDLFDAPDQATEDQLFADHLFQKIPPTEPNANWWKPNKKGIFFVRRRSGCGNENLRLLPQGQEGNGLLLDKNFIIIVSNGNVLIPSTIKAPLDKGAPKYLFSLAALAGDICIGTGAEIHAYLIALKKSGGVPGGGGKLMSHGGNSSFNIFGGVAVHEMGCYKDNAYPSTMSNFPFGGVIKYNPRFNPCSPVYPAAWEVLVEDKTSRVRVKGGNE